MNNMKKTLQQKIEEAYEELKDIALELVDDLELSDDLGDNYACFIDKELYKDFQKVSGIITKLHEKQQAEDKKQLKLAFKR
jgi:hypothetical protein